MFAKPLLKITLFCLLAMPVRGDELVLKNGNSLRGIVSSETEEKVSFETAVGEVSLSRSSIESLVRFSEEDNQFVRAELFALRRRTEKAVAVWGRLLANGTSPPKIAESIVNVRESLLENLPELSDKKKSAFTLILLQLAKTNRANHDFLFFAGELLFSIGELSNAVDLFSAIPEEFFDRLENEAKTTFLVSCFIKQIKALIVEENFDYALDVIESLDKYDTGVGKSCKVLLYIRLANSTIKEGDYRAGLELFAETIYDLSPVIAKNRIEHQLNDITRILVNDGEFDKAIELYKTYGIRIIPDQTVVVLSELYVKYGNVLSAERNFDKAQEIFEELNDLGQSKKAEKLINMCKYEKSKSRLNSIDYLGHYELGEKCVEWELYSAAISEFKNATGSKQLEENARLQIEYITERQAYEMLQECYDLYRRERYNKALSVAIEFKSKFPDSDLVKEANGLGDLCTGKMNQRFFNSPIKAQILYQRAEQNYFLEDYEQALDLLEIILLKHKNLPVAEKARGLKSMTYKKILFSKQLADVGRDAAKSAAVRWDDFHTTQSLRFEINQILEELRVSEE